MAGSNVMMKVGVSRAGSLDIRSSLQILREPIFVAGLLIAAIAAIAWFRVLSTENLSTCYPLFVSMTYCLIAVAGIHFFHESLSFQKGSGMVLILLGIFVVARG
jgi:multidrug transporter EmrE-like cation transporter